MGIGYWCQFIEDFPVWSAIAGKVIVPAGFFSNGASIPPILYSVLDDTHPDILYPAYAHDYLFSVNGNIPGGRTLTREQCNYVIRELMLGIGAPLWKANAVHAALVIGSKWAWNDSITNTKKNAQT